MTSSATRAITMSRSSSSGSCSRASRRNARVVLGGLVGASSPPSQPMLPHPLTDDRLDVLDLWMPLSSTHRRRVSLEPSRPCAGRSGGRRHPQLVHPTAALPLLPAGWSLPLPALGRRPASAGSVTVKAPGRPLLGSAGTVTARKCSPRAAWCGRRHAMPSPLRDPVERRSRAPETRPLKEAGHRVDNPSGAPPG